MRAPPTYSCCAARIRRARSCAIACVWLASIGGCVTSAPETSGQLGDPCLSHRDCTAVFGDPWTEGAGAVCLTQAPGGYCSTGCEHDDHCPASGICWRSTDAQSGDRAGVCVVSCEPGSCRNGLECREHPGGAGAGCIWPELPFMEVP